MAVHNLFAIKDRGLLRAFLHLNKKNKPWKEVMPDKFKCFAGNYHGHTTCKDFFRFETAPLTRYPHVQLKLAPPPKRDGANTSVSFLNSRDYSKRLIGNAFSVPVIAKLLEPLQPLFKQREYQKYWTYKFHALPA